MSDFYMLLQGDEDGNPARILRQEQLEWLLSDPEEEYGVTEFKDAAWLGANQDPNYWPDGVAVLLRCEAVIPKPSGKYVLP